MKEIYLVGALVIAILGIGIYLIIRKISELKDNNKTDDNLLEWLKTTSKQLEETNNAFNSSLRQTNQNITSTLQSNTKALNERLDNAARVIGAVGKEVGQMAEIGRSMKDLQDFLRSPKLRGNIGEQVLKDLLTQTFPKQSFHLQYKFRSGETVDAAIQTDAGIIPIDSKFPMENFKKMMQAKTEVEKNLAQKDFIRDVKRHIDAISKKYILPEEGTIDYALMYVPSEPVYYEMVANCSELYDYSHQKRVLPVSPSTFYAYLRAILMSFEGKKIEQKARLILASLRALEKDSDKFSEGLGILNRHVTNAYNQMSNVVVGFNQLGQKIKTTRELDPQTNETKVITGDQL